MRGTGKIIRLEFQIDGKTYLLDIEIGFFKVKYVHLGEDLDPERKLPYGKLTSVMPVKFKTVPFLKILALRLCDLKHDLAEKRRKRH